MKLLSFCVATAMAIVTASANAQAAAAPPVTTSAAYPPLHSMATGKTHRIVIAVPSADPKDWDMAVGNAHTLISLLKPDVVQIEIVAYSQGIEMLKLGTPVATDIADLQKLGVRFAACERAMRGHDLALKDLVAGAIPVPAGVAEVVIKQEEGWTYLKAGH